MHRSHAQRWQPFALLMLGLVVLMVMMLSVTSVSEVEAQAQFGINWTGVFYNTRDLSGPQVYTQQYPNGINENFGEGSPNPAVNPDGWSARFDSVQQFNQAVYEFVVFSDDGVRVYIDGTLLLDVFVPRPLTTDRFQVSLTAGAHNIRIEYLEDVGTAALQFQYFQTSALPTTGTPGIGVIFGTPTGVPTRTPTPLPPIPAGAQTATVIRAQVLLVRSAPYLGAPVVGRIIRGQTYQVLGRDPDARWFLLQLSNTQGWAWGYYLFVSGNEFTAPIQGSFTTAGDPAAGAQAIAQTNAVLKLRGAPDVTVPQTGRIPWGDLLPIIGRTADGGWYQVVFRGTVGWVASAFVTILEGNINNVPITG